MKRLQQELVPHVSMCRTKRFIKCSIPLHISNEGASLSYHVSHVHTKKYASNSQKITSTTQMNGMRCFYKLFSVLIVVSVLAVFLLYVNFSDEKKFNLDGPDGFASYWRDLKKEPRLFFKCGFGAVALCYRRFFQLLIRASSPKFCI